MENISINRYYTLSNGNKIPCIGLGTYQSGCKLYDTVMSAIKLGYRLIDTARYYENEEMIGEAIIDSGIRRECLFLSTKVWHEDMQEGLIEKSVERSLKDLRTDYLDMLLLHWPFGDIHYSWHFLENLYEQGIVKNIGVSNFQIHHLTDLLSYCCYKPVINQIEWCVTFKQTNLISFCESNDIRVEAWGPFGKGSSIKNGTIQSLAEKYNVTASQIILRWIVDEGGIVIPKSIHKDRLILNSDIYSFDISQDDMSKIDQLNTGRSSRYYMPEYQWI